MDVIKLVDIVTLKYEENQNNNKRETRYFIVRSSYFCFMSVTVFNSNGNLPPTSEPSSSLLSLSSKSSSSSSSSSSYKRSKS